MRSEDNLWRIRTLALSTHRSTVLVVDCLYPLSPLTHSHSDCTQLIPALILRLRTQCRGSNSPLFLFVQATILQTCAMYLFVTVIRCSFTVTFPLTTVTFFRTLSFFNTIFFSIQQLVLTVMTLITEKIIVNEYLYSVVLQVKI